MTYYLFVQETNQGSGQLLDMLLLQMTLARDTRRERERESRKRKTERDRENERGREMIERKNSERPFEPPPTVLSKSVLHAGHQSLAVISPRPCRLLTCFYPLATHVSVCHHHSSHIFIQAVLAEHRPTLTFLLVKVV